MTEGRDLPWLQDTSGGDVTTNWSAGYRDFVILDPANELPVAAFNLTTNSLSDAGNREALKAILLDLVKLKDDDGDKLSDYWEDEMFDGDLSTGPSDDRDLDEADGLLEYALGSDAGSAADLPQTKSSTVAVGEDRFHAISFRRRLGEAGGLAYLVEASTGLESWSSASEDVVEFSRKNPYDGTGTEIVTYRSTRPISADAEGRGFLRVRASVPAPLER